MQNSTPSFKTPTVARYQILQHIPILFPDARVLSASSPPKTDLCPDPRPIIQNHTQTTGNKPIARKLAGHANRLLAHSFPSMVLGLLETLGLLRKTTLVSPARVSSRPSALPPGITLFYSPQVGTRTVKMTKARLNRCYLLNSMDRERTSEQS